MLVELCDVGGKRDGVGAAVWNAVPLEEERGGGVGGDGSKVILVRCTTQTQQKDKAALRQQCLFMQGSMCANRSVEWEQQAL